MWSDHLTFFARYSVSVLLPFDHFQVRASHGTAGSPPSGEMTSGSYIAPLMNCPLGRPVAVYGLKFLTNAGSPDPVMTRHLCAAVRVSADGAAPRVDAAGDTVATTSTASAASAPIPASAANGRLGDPPERDISL